ncbi:gluconate 2-dehydrogenase subunit 3 family protein [Flavobacteriaceae bacterium TP-CH-4]|uniref:Gluconate 2-dehydrogenase subunit 3 family protein n=1 Tax=Pelagihabitans pacificus TaxID=2696054 RepID=A0A967EDM6_9FLAO|nr:gluconate 2-dehydrogenase subunit 3 family protein [Pelagihabitans pacificus]NHF59493.1 gluconate 2-dehydrogenase subunit 3 family protein [Pelagihabitans pacificus]
MDRRKALKKTGLLAGAAMVAPSFLSIFQSCKQESRLDWQPMFFDENEAKTIAALVDVILPRTDTPGALDVKVDLFIDKVIAMTYVEEAQQAMRSEIATFNANCKQDFGTFFFDLDETDRVAVLEAAEKSSGKFNPGVWGTTVGEQEPIGFYRSMKSMAIWAYFTSEEIGENVLSYDPVPGTYEGCKPVSEVGNRWSL